MAASDSERIEVKTESIEGGFEPEGLLPPAEVQVPVNFDEKEWEELTQVIITAVYHAFD